jgi:hypothetical protein
MRSRESSSAGDRARAVRRLTFCALVPVLLAGCARTGGVQIGGDVPEEPVRVTGSQPGHLTTVDPFGGPVRIQFERTLSERPTQGSPAEAVVVSPRSGDVMVSVGRGGIEIAMEGGFRQETVYRITVLPRFRDRFDNRMDGTFELIFSTGPELEPNLLAGITSDRLTLQPESGMRVDARPPGDGPIHSTLSDSLGVFTFPHLPAGRYTLVAYDDLNRNREPDFLERQDVTEVGMNLGDTLIVTELQLLAPDTTAAVLEEIALVDSITLRVGFDDHLDPEAPLSDVQAILTRDDANAPEVEEILTVDEWSARDADPSDDPDDPDAAPATPAPAPDPGPGLPSQELILILSRPLLPEVSYTLTMGGVRNINGVADGGGVLEFEGPAAPPDPADDPVPGDVLPGDVVPDAPSPGFPVPGDPAPGDTTPGDPVGNP